MLTEKQQAAAAERFVRKWRGKGYEKGDSQSFWIELLTEVYGVEDPSAFIRFEEQVKVDKTNFIDAHISVTKVLIEQKSIGKNLREAITQSDGSRLTPFQQAKRYAAEMPYSQRPRWIVTCNFSEFLVYDMEHPNGEPESILLENLGKEYYRLQFLVSRQSEHITKEMQVSMKAGEIVGRIYEALLQSIPDSQPMTGERGGYTHADMLHGLNRLCVQIVFCLYAEDAGVFAHDQFHDYLEQYAAKDMRRALISLFDILDTPYDERDPFLEKDLAGFPYVNGGLFSRVAPLSPEKGKGVRLIPQFTDELRATLLQNASLDFDWSEISPTIFGAVFESTLNPETRRSGGMHYTSIENIHKVIDPLFLNDLRHEFNEILEVKVERQRNRRLDAFQDKLASLTFLDPACGSGNFLTESYLSLRRLENELIRERYHGQTFLGLEEVNPVKVSINQFYGIEINDFAVTVATTALWISEAQMLAETERIIQRDIDFLPLKSYANIREGNALRMEWDVIEEDTGVLTIQTTNVHLMIEPEPSMAGEPVGRYGDVNVRARHLDGDIIPDKRRYQIHYDYIMGNPPFVGARLMDGSQKKDVALVFGRQWKNAGNLDYVCCWYKKAARLMAASPDTKTAFVSTNSVCQGEQVADLWEPLFQSGFHFFFAHRTFRWDSEASIKAHVHCVIIGFGKGKPSRPILYEGDRMIPADNINAYLMDAPDVFVGSRQHPLCDVPQIGIGNKPIDGGNYLFEKEEMEEFVKAEPLSAAYFKEWYGAVEFIHQKPRYCLWLGGCSPAELQRMPHCMKRIEAVIALRKESKSAGTRKLAERPTRFHVENMPHTNYIIIPRVSSERRRYIPMGFMSPDALASDSVHIIPDATLYHFGILESHVHMAWMRAVCGRLKSDYRYSKDIVYNNFPWPAPTETQKARIEQTAQAILDARALYPDSSLADLYDERTMPPELRRAHQDNDRAVMQAYGFDVKTMTEDQCVACLLRMYQMLTTA